MVDNNSTENKISNRLIKFNSNQKVDSCYACKITINAIAKKLIVEAQAQDSEKIEASFDHSFFIQKNILCVLNPKSNNIEFVLIFKNETIAKKVFDVINKTKSANDFETHEQENNDEIFDNKFLFPLFDSISSSKTETFSISMVHNFINSSINRKKERYIRILKEKNIYNIIFPETANFDKIRKRRDMPISSETSANKKIKEEVIGTEKLFNSGNNAVGKNVSFNSKVPAINFKENEDYFDDSDFDESSNKTNDSNFEISDLEEIEEDISDFDDSLKSSNPIPTLKNQAKILRPPNFIFRENNKGKHKSQLIIFDEKDRNLCYKYYNKYKSETFLCYNCSAKKQYCKAKVIKDKGEECILLGNFNHVCELLHYEPERQKQIIKLPDFELRTNSNGVPKSILFIFNTENRDLCYRLHLSKNYFSCYDCYKENKWTTAKLFQDKNGEDYIVAKENDHVCIPRPYEPMKLKQIIKAPMFEWQTNDSLVSIMKLIIFTSKLKDSWYVYTKNHVTWRCVACKKLGVFISIKIFNNENGEECVEINNENHACEPVSDIREEKYKIIKSPNFELRSTKAGIPNKVLIIFANDDKSLCYNFHFNSNNVFVCMACSNKKAYLSAKMMENENGEKYIKIKDTPHVCEPKEYKPNKKPCEIVKSPNYELRPNINGIPDSLLVIFVGNDRKECYNFLLKKGRNWFFCSRCSNNKKSTSAIIIKNDDGTEHVEIQTINHTCKPVKYREPNKIFIIKSPNFQILDNDKTSVPKSILIIYENSKKSSHYRFYLKRGEFVCNECLNKHNKTTSAKLFKDGNGEECIQLNNKHACQPRKGKPQ